MIIDSPTFDGLGLDISLGSTEGVLVPLGVGDVEGTGDIIEGLIDGVDEFIDGFSVD